MLCSVAAVVLMSACLARPPEGGGEPAAAGCEEAAASAPRERPAPPGARKRTRDRKQMVTRQIEEPDDGRHKVTSKAVLEAMRVVPRHVFIPAKLSRHAYADSPLPIGQGQTISQPYIVAWMTELLELEAKSRVLEIGTGSGYQAAVLAHLTPHVYTIEIIKPLATKAKAKLGAEGYEEVECRQGDGYYGWQEQAPFDAIIVTCAAGHLPPPLWDQLAPGGAYRHTHRGTVRGAEAGGDHEDPGRQAAFEDDRQRAVRAADAQSRRRSGGGLSDVTRLRPRTGPSLLAVALVSAAVLGHEVSLMRMLLVVSWHHFAFLVISLALLGFGASGTALALLRRYVLARREPVFFGLVLATALAIALSTFAVCHVPVEARVTPLLLGRQLGAWALLWTLLAVPFLLGAAAIGLALMDAGERLPRVYAANLVGSGVGAAVAPLVMHISAPPWLPPVWGGVGLAALCFEGMRSRRRLGATVLGVAIVAVILWADPPRLRPDSFKAAAYMARLVEQESAVRLGVSHGPRGTVESFRSELFHDIPFLAPTTLPPAVDALLIDGHHVGSILRIERREEASFLDHTLMGLAYELAPSEPRVLLLGERTGLHVWLAALSSPRSVEAVQSDRNVLARVRAASSSGADPFALPAVRAIVDDPRRYVEGSDQRFDVIELVALEGSAAGAGGIGGLAEDYLATVQGFAASLSRLEPAGIVVAVRGIQTPPRDNLKLIASVVAALRHLGVEKPEQRIVIVRDFLGVATLVRGSPWPPEAIDPLRRTIARRELTPVWFPGVRPDELNRPDSLPGPEGTNEDWYSHTATRLFASDETLLRDWLYHVAPATDDSPFFLDFCRLSALDRLRELFGDLWLTRSEAAFLFVLVAAATVGLLGLLLTVVPLVLSAAVRATPGKTIAALYFGALGLGYLLLEMAVLSRLTLLVGDPLTAASVTIAGFLVFSGLGSAVAARCGADASRPARFVPWLTVGLAVLAALEVPLLTRLGVATGGVSPGLRVALAVCVLSPLAFLMGFPMPLGLARLDRSAAPLVPWAWGVNGFASVLAAPLATIIAMSSGYSTVTWSACVLYVTAALLFRRLGAEP